MKKITFFLVAIAFLASFSSASAAGCPTVTLDVSNIFQQELFPGSGVPASYTLSWSVNGNATKSIQVVTTSDAGVNSRIINVSGDVTTQPDLLIPLGSSLTVDVTTFSAKDGGGHSCETVSGTGIPI